MQTKQPSCVRTKEQEIKQWEDSLNLFTQFLDRYPYEKIANLNEKLTEFKNQLDALSLNIEKEKIFIVDQAYQYCS